jgi:hypothetical protein
VGAGDGRFVGRRVGLGLGAAEGAAVGIFVGRRVGFDVGSADGS